MKSKISWLFSILVAIQAGIWVVYTRQCHFYWDDYPLLFWMSTRPFREMVFTGFLWGDQNYRPVLPVIHRIQLQLFGFNAWLYYLMNIAVIFIGLFFAWKSHRFLFRNISAPVFYCFALLPVFFLSFVHISNLILFFGFMFFSISLYLFLRYLKTAKWVYLMISSAFFFLALSTKEMFILMPLAFIAYDILFTLHQDRQYRFTLKKCAVYFVFFIPLFLYLGIRLFALRDVGGYEFYYHRQFTTYLRYLFIEPFILLNISYFFPFSWLEAILKLLAFSLIVCYRPSGKTGPVILLLFFCLVLVSLPEWPIKALHYELPVTVLPRNPVISFGEASSARYWFMPAFYLYVIALYLLSRQPLTRRNIILVFCGLLLIFNLHTSIRSLQDFAWQSDYFRNYYRAIDQSLQKKLSDENEADTLIYLANPARFYRKPEGEAMFHALAGLYMEGSPFWKNVVLDRSQAQYLVVVDKNFEVIFLRDLPD